MIQIITYHKETSKVISIVSLEFNNDVYLDNTHVINRSEYGVIPFLNSDPVLYTDEDGDPCLNTNALIISSEQLK